MVNLSTLLLLGLALTFVLIWMSLLVGKGSPTASPGVNNCTRFFLVVLRVAIGVQLLVEGMDKLSDPAWTSEAYLRGAQGPAAPFFQTLAGDTLRDRIEVKDKTFPPALDREWQNYLASFKNHYQLDAEKLALKVAIDDGVPERIADPKKADKADPKAEKQAEPKAEKQIDKKAEPKAAKAAEKQVTPPNQVAHADAVLKQQKAQTLRWLTETSLAIDRKAPRGDSVPVSKTVQEWLKEIDAINERIARAEADKQWQLDKDGERNWEKQIRASLKRGLDERNAAFKVALESILTDEQQSRGKAPATGYWGPPLGGNWLQWSDFMVKWGLVVSGGALIAGLFTRSAAIIGAMLLLSFYVAMPPLPGLPANPRSEGHYIFINKTLIEAIALLAIATTQSGRWLGIDGLLQFLNPFRWRASKPRDTTYGT